MKDVDKFLKCSYMVAAVVEDNTVGRSFVDNGNALSANPGWQYTEEGNGILLIISHLENPMMRQTTTSAKRRVLEDRLPKSDGTQSATGEEGN